MYSTSLPVELGTPDDLRGADSSTSGVKRVAWTVMVGGVVASEGVICITNGP